MAASCDIRPRPFGDACAMPCVRQGSFKKKALTSSGREGKRMETAEGERLPRHGYLNLEVNRH